MSKHIIIQYSCFGGKLSVKDTKTFLQKSYDNKLSDHDDYKVDHELSGSRYQAYYHPEKQHLVTVHRGTANMADWLTDLKYAFNHKSKRFDHAKKKQQDHEIYKTIMHHVRDMRVLSQEQICVLNGFSRRKLLNIIALYNMVMRSVNEII